MGDEMIISEGGRDELVKVEEQFTKMSNKLIDIMSSSVEQDDNIDEKLENFRQVQSLTSVD